MSIKTAIYDDTTEEFLLLTDNEPDITAHTLWRLGVLHIYRPGNWPNILVSVDSHGERNDWEFQTLSSSPPSGLPPHPWISYDEVTFGLADTEIVPFDIWRRSDRRELHPQHWDEFDRPMLVRLPAAPLAPTPRRQPDLSAPASSSRLPLPARQPDLSAPASSSRLPLPAPSAPPASREPSGRPVRQPDLSATAAVAPVASSGRLPFPLHIQRLVIDAAIAAATTCPITMEPITAATAVITPCGHVFGTELTPRVSLCPVCRSSLL
jgi:hypothetical protein